MIHLRFNNVFILFILEIELDINRIYFVFSVYNISSVKYNLSYVLELFREFVNCIGRYKLFKGIL